MYSKFTLLLLVVSFGGILEANVISTIFGKVLNAQVEVKNAEIGLLKSLANGSGVGNATKNVLDAKLGVVKAIVGGTVDGVKNVANEVRNGAGIGNTGTGNSNGTKGNCTISQERAGVHNNAQQVLSSGQQKIGALAARLGSFALFWNSTKEQALIDLIHGFAAFKDQADSVSADLKTNLNQIEDKEKTASREEKARLECDKSILKSDLDSVKAANDQVLNDTRIQAPFEQVQEELKHVFDDFSTTDCPTFDDKVTRLLAKVKSISDEGVYYGIKRSDELKVRLEAEKLKESDDITQLEDLQNQYKDRVLHLLSFIIPEHTIVKNLIAKANELLLSAEESKKTCLVSSIDKLKNLEDYFDGQINGLYPRLLDV